MITKINKGDKFVCVKDVVMDSEYTNIAYTTGNIYQSEYDGCITDDKKNNLHRWSKKTGAYFIPYTYTAIYNHYRSLTTDAEAMPFARLLNGMDAGVGHSSAGVGNYRSKLSGCPDTYTDHKPNGIYTEPTLTSSDLIDFMSKSPKDRLSEMNIPDEPVTAKQIIAVDKMIAECGVKQQTIYEQDAELIAKLKGMALPDYYDNTNGSLYKIAEQRGWNFYQADCVKRIDRCMKKGNFKQDIEKTIALLNLWLEESK